MLDKIKAIIFDMDGTLIDSMWIWPSLDEKFFANEGLKQPETLQQDIEGLSMHETAEYFIQHYSIKYSVDELISIWNDMAKYEYTHEVIYKPGAFSFLERLKAQGFKTGIATSNSRELVEAVDESLKFSEYIDCIVTSQEVPKGKPAPDIYLRVAEELQVKPEQCLVFEDIPNGLVAAIKAGMATCAIHDDFSKELEDQKKELADHFIYSYDEITFN